MKIPCDKCENGVVAIRNDMYYSDDYETCDKCNGTCFVEVTLNFIKQSIKS